MNEKDIIESSFTVSTLNSTPSRPSGRTFNEDWICEFVSCLMICSVSVRILPRGVLAIGVREKGLLVVRFLKLGISPKFRT